MSSLSQWGLIRYRDKWRPFKDVFSTFYEIKVCSVYLLEFPDEANLMRTHNILFLDKIQFFLNYSYKIFLLGYRKNSLGTQKQVRISHSKRAIGVICHWRFTLCTILTVLDSRVVSSGSTLIAVLFLILDWTLFASVDMSKVNKERSHFRNSGVKALTITSKSSEQI